MKLRFTISLFILASFCFLFMSNSGGRASILGEGNTGAPGDDSKTCASCHGGGDFGAEIEIKMFDMAGSEVSEYLGGETYTVQARITTTTTPGGYGLQMVGLIDNGDVDTEGFSNPSSNSQIVSAMGRTYLEQQGLSSSDVFESDWTAPANGSGSVSFYAAGHASNANGSTNGDDSTQGSITFQETTVSNTLEEQLQLTVYPNPVDNFTTIKWGNDKAVNISVSDITGKVVMNTEALGTQTELNLSSLNTGIYFLSIIDNSNNRKTVQKITKR